MKRVWCVGWLVSLCVGSWASEVQAQSAGLPSFREAYQREKQELLQTLAVQRKTLRALRQRNTRRKASLQQKVRGLMAMLSGLRKQGTVLEEQVTSLKRRWSQVREYKDLLKGTLRLGTRTLREELPDVRLEGSMAHQIHTLFTEGSAYLLRCASVHQDKGVFFDVDGHQRKGQIVHVGEIAALGLSSERGGVLRKLKDGGLRLLPPEEGDREAAQALVKGKSLETVPVYLFDPLSKQQAGGVSRGTWATLEAGGPIAWVIMGLALLGLLLSLERCWTLFGASLGAARRWRDVLSAAKAGALERARQGCVRMGIAGPVLSGVLASEERSQEALEQEASALLVQEMPRLERSHALLGVIVTVAPLLGLLGTVTGMISTFDVITTHGTGNPRLLSDGISEALITTQLGLAVAIPFLLARSFFVRWSDRLVEETQLRALLLIECLKGPVEAREGGDAAVMAPLVTQKRPDEEVSRRGG